MTLGSTIQDNVMDSVKTGLTAAAMHLAIELTTEYLGHAVVFGSALSTGGLAFAIHATNNVAKSALGYVPKPIKDNLYLEHKFVASVIDAALLFGLTYAAVTVLAPMAGVAVGVNVIGVWVLTAQAKPIADAFTIPKLPSFGSTQEATAG